MESLLARYLDGELNDEEAAAFLSELERNPSLERELRGYERMLAAGKSLETAQLSPSFVDEVMDTVRKTPLLAVVQSDRAVADGSTGRGRSRRGRSYPSWMPALATAAAVILAFGLGQVSSGGGDGPASPEELSRTGLTGSTMATASGATSRSGLQMVRLIYVPERPEVGQVTVAGSFNGWDNMSIPLSKEGSVWTTILTLPPGSYEYMFVVDGEQWVTDPLATKTRDDGFGGRNAVLDLEV